MIVLAAAMSGNVGAVRALPAKVAPLRQQEAPKPPLSGSSAPAPSQDAPVATPPATSRLVLNLVAVPLHSPAQATVTLAQAKRSEGRGGNLQLKIESIRLADGELVPVRGVENVKGAEHRTAAKVGLGGYLFNVNGENAKIPAGTEITAYIFGDHPLEPSKFPVASGNPEKKDGLQ